MEITTQFDSGLPVWRDYLPYLKQLPKGGFPSCRELNALLQDDVLTQSGQKIRFAPSDQLADEPYEVRIFNSGLVSTRPDSWHDLFNALVWARFPRTKAAINECHNRAWPEQQHGQRGPLRDALTLFDECGVIMFSSSLQILESISERRWPDAFLYQRFEQVAGICVCGHAMLEKYLSPYKSMTAKALLIHVSESFMARPREEILLTLDRWVAGELQRGRLLQAPPCMAPLPLAGVPGWWPRYEQEQDDFYRDPEVFRAPPANLQPAPVFRLTAGLD